jgi:PadR family transcriptional regulator, regulatory protein PadR
MERAPGRRMTLPTQLVLRAMIADPTRLMDGLEIGSAAQLAAGTIHPVLARLESWGWLESHWAEIDHADAGRPRRRLYRLTPDGVVGAARALDRARTSASLLSRLRPGLAERPA